MANYDNLVASIKDAIKNNNKQAITGQVLQDAMLEMVSQLGKNYAFGGVATPSTNPVTPTTNTFYIATEAGTYTNMGGVVVAPSEIAVIAWDGSSWSVSAAHSSLAVIQTLPMVYAAVPTSDIGSDGDYALALFTDPNVRVYVKQNGSWSVYTDYSAAFLICGDRFFYKGGNAHNAFFTEVGVASAKAILLATQSTTGVAGEEGLYAIFTNGTNSHHIYYFSAGVWKPMYCRAGYEKTIFNIGGKMYRFTNTEGLLPTMCTEELISLGARVSEVEMMLSSTPSMSNVFMKFDRVVGTTDSDGASMRYLYTKVGQSKNNRIHVKANYTGRLTFYGSTDGSDNTGALIDIADTDFNNGYETELYIPEGVSILRPRTYLAGVQIEITSYVEMSQTVGSEKCEWQYKTISAYGDSIVAMNGTDYIAPFSDYGHKWMLQVADALGCVEVNVRGIGGQRFAWNNNGGSVAWLDAKTGVTVGRNDSYNYDNYAGNVTIPNGKVAVRGALSSWLRITSSYPEAIKHNIDAVFVMAHNDAQYFDATTEATFVDGSTTDPEWAASSYYNGGDFNIDTVRGGIASTIMKLQAWMPNAVIVLCTPLNSKGEQGEINTNINNVMYPIMLAVKDIHEKMSTPCIDVYGTSGINGFNRTKYITDTIHPYTEAGAKMIAKAIIGGMKGIMPNG